MTLHIFFEDGRAWTREAWGFRMEKDVLTLYGDDHNVMATYEGVLAVMGADEIR